MGLFDKIRGEFVDIIEWTDSTSNSMVYRFERYDNEIKMGAKLTVREGQAAVFISKGQIADVYKPGMYTLETDNMPVLSTLMGWKHGFHSPRRTSRNWISTPIWPNTLKRLSKRNTKPSPARPAGPKPRWIPIS